VADAASASKMTHLGYDLWLNHRAPLWLSPGSGGLYMVGLRAGTASSPLLSGKGNEGSASIDECFLVTLSQ
jgi:hypothetical protein